MKLTLSNVLSIISLIAVVFSVHFYNELTYASNNAFKELALEVQAIETKRELADVRQFMLIIRQNTKDSTKLNTDDKIEYDDLLERKKELKELLMEIKKLRLQKLKGK